MSVFGWSLPAGCNTLPDEESDSPCECCGNFPDDCICPECPQCGVQGDPNCYRVLDPGSGERHGLKYNKEQRRGQAKRRIENLQNQISDEYQYIDWLDQQPEDWQDR